MTNILAPSAFKERLFDVGITLLKITLGSTVGNRYKQYHLNVI